MRRVIGDLMEAAIPARSHASSRIAERIIEEIAEAPMAACGVEYGVEAIDIGAQTPRADPRWMAALYTLSGALIVADILAAYAERSLLPGAPPTEEVPTDDRAPQAYVRAWMLELGLYPGRLRSMAELCGRPVWSGSAGCI